MRAQRNDDRKTYIMLFVYTSPDAGAAQSNIHLHLYNNASKQRKRQRARAIRYPNFHISFGIAYVHFHDLLHSIWNCGHFYNLWIENLWMSHFSSAFHLFLISWCWWRKNGSQSHANFHINSDFDDIGKFISSEAITITAVHSYRNFRYASSAEKNDPCSMLCRNDCVYDMP